MSHLKSILQASAGETVVVFAWLLVIPLLTSNTLLTVQAANDQETSEYSEEESDREDEESEEQPSQNKNQELAVETVTRTYTVIEQETRIVKVTPPEYESDRDGDLLVDALDPHPDQSEYQFFTDDDGDSVANAYDRFPDQDDLVIFESETDENANGIIDRYES